MSPSDTPDMTDELRLLEALLFAASSPLDEAAIKQRLPEGTDPAPLLAELAAFYATRGVNIVQVAGGWTLRTAPDLAPRLKLTQKVGRKLSRAAIETLAIIAYHQPVTRAEIEEIRGVVISRGTLDTLMEAGWIVPRGRKQTVGRPATWVTTDAFLDHFGLAGLGDLPGMEELRAAGLVGPRPVATLRETIGGDRLPDLPRAEGEDEEASDDAAAPEEREQSAADRAAEEAEAEHAAKENEAEAAAEEAEAERAEAEPAESESDRS
jgi:segregation and condensation protein B